MSQYAQEIKHILASLNEPENGNEHPLPDEEALETIHVYPVEGGGLLFSPKELEPEQPTIIDSQQQPTNAKEPPFFLYFCLILCFFLLFDVADNQLLALMTPTATITIIPDTQPIAITTDIPGKDIQAHLLPQLTLSQSQTLPATGKGHQDARSAKGTLTFYNGSFSPQTVYAGTVFTSSDGVKIATSATVTIPANNPPQDGIASTAAYALILGSQGNIAAGDINLALSSDLLVKNLAAFTGGLDARDYLYVTRDDIQHGTATLSSQLVRSELAAFTSQLTPDEALVTPTCTPTVTSNHQPGEEAAEVAVTLSETCSTTAYNQQALQQVAARQLSAKEVKEYRLMGAIQVTVLSTIQGSATLKVHIAGTWVYQINQQQIANLIAGKPRLAALQFLSSLPGIRRVSITGIADDTPLPEDPQHIHFLVLVGL